MLDSGIWVNVFEKYTLIQDFGFRIWADLQRKIHPYNLIIRHNFHRNSAQIHTFIHTFLQNVDPKVLNSSLNSIERQSQNP